MESQHRLVCSCDPAITDHGPAPFATNIVRAASKNQSFRTAFWTGEHLQMTLMELGPCGEIGAERHPDTDQYIRVEAGRALVCAGHSAEHLEDSCCLCPGDAVFVPAGTWHNIKNVGKGRLKLSSIYAPPHHPRGTVHPTRADAAGGGR